MPELMAWFESLDGATRVSLIIAMGMFLTAATICGSLAIGVLFERLMRRRRPIDLSELPR
ncbi:MAG: hypothetical protein ABR961_03275 [Thermoanaerobaculaceae bacterium]|jgi:hypothetical protein